MMPLLAWLVVALQSPATLEIRVGNDWQPLPAYGPGATAAPAPAIGAALVWTDSAPGVRVGAFTVRTVRGLLRNSIAVVELDAPSWRFGIGLTPGRARRTVDDWFERDSTVSLAVSAGLFQGDGVPMGLVLQDGKTRYRRRRSLDAVVAIENGVIRLTDLGGVAALAPRASAFQTVPWLVRDQLLVLGRARGPHLSRDHRDRRLTLCLMDSDHVRFVLSNFEVFGAAAGSIPIGLTLPEQASIAAGLGCRDAVALDGGISAQLAARLGDHTVRMPGWRRIPLMLLARRP